MLELEPDGLSLKIGKIGLLPAILWCALATAALGFTDLVVGTEISFSIFYLIPITLAVFLNGFGLGIAFSFICALVWVVADLEAGLRVSSWIIPAWNTLVRLGYFLFHAALLARLLEAIRAVKDLSLHDPLTKAANWRLFEEYANRLLKSATRSRRKITVAYIDVDNFKKVNDTLGHGVGDEALIAIARAIQSEIRPDDLVARLGGDEFAVLLDGADFAASRDALERIVGRVGAAMRERSWPVTLSVGAMVFSVIPSSIGPMLKIVDDLMYEVKKGGKNALRVVEQGAAAG
jgi:diguanylate cyclase (GGDEF)-like protein